MSAERYSHVSCLGTSTLDHRVKFKSRFRPWGRAAIWDRRGRICSWMWQNLQEWEKGLWALGPTAWHIYWCMRWSLSWGCSRSWGSAEGSRPCEGQSWLSCWISRGHGVRMRPVCVPSHRARTASALTSSNWLTLEETRPELPCSA